MRCLLEPELGPGTVKGGRLFSESQRRRFLKNFEPYRPSEWWVELRKWKSLSPPLDTGFLEHLFAGVSGEPPFNCLGGFTFVNRNDVAERPIRL